MLFFHVEQKFHQENNFSCNYTTRCGPSKSRPKSFFSFKFLLKSAWNVSFPEIKKYFSNKIVLGRRWIVSRIWRRPSLSGLHNFQQPRIFRNSSRKFLIFHRFSSKIQSKIQNCAPKSTFFIYRNIIKFIIKNSKLFPNIYFVLGRPCYVYVIPDHDTRPLDP